MKTKHILPWKLWTEEKPTVAGEYWLAFYEPPDEDCSWLQKEPEEPIIWEVDEGYLDGRYDIEHVMNWPEENVIWFGPLKPPGFLGKKK